MKIFKKLLEKKERVDWFTVRVDEKMHAAEDYYKIIPFGMCLSIIAARLHANMLHNIDIDLKPKISLTQIK